MSTLRKSPFYSADHEAFRNTIARFVAREIEPFATEWDEAGAFPRELYKKASEIGLLQLGFPEEFGGVQVDRFYLILAAQELAKTGSGGVALRPGRPVGASRAALRGHRHREMRTVVPGRHDV